MDVGRALTPEERKLLTPRDVQVAREPDGTVVVAWEAPADPRHVGSYRVLSDAVEVAVVPATQTSTALVLDPGAEHYVQVQAVDTEGQVSNRTESAVIALHADESRSPEAVFGVLLVVSLLFAAFMGFAAALSAGFCSDWDPDPDCGDRYRSTALQGLIPLLATIVFAMVIGGARWLKHRGHRPDEAGPPEPTAS